ncbi:MAG: YebC/PmpR family DNA-binding transcriptional regulator [Patescibacteria group bacterium]
MSGHSKWSQIKRQKAKTDVKKGLTFTKLSNAIVIAIKQGGGITDPTQNFRLRLAVDSARSSNMPKENIERAIQKATGKEAGNMEEVIYEGFAPGGVSVIVEAATDNVQRTTSEIKNIFNKSGGSFGQPGSVSYQFSQLGKITIDKDGKSYDEIFEAAVESGADDVEDADGEVAIYTSVSNLAKVKNDLSDKGFNITDARLWRKPNVKATVGDEEQLGKIINFIDTVNNLDDVQNVYSNLE